MDLVDVEAEPACCTPPVAGVSMRSSTGERRGSGASAPSSTRASPIPSSGASKGSVNP